MRHLSSVIHTLQYCLETFEQTCACGRCDPCTRGQQDINVAAHRSERTARVGIGSNGDRQDGGRDCDTRAYMAGYGVPSVRKESEATA